MLQLVRKRKCHRMEEKMGWNKCNGERGRKERQEKRARVADPGGEGRRERGEGRVSEDKDK